MSENNAQSLACSMHTTLVSSVSSIPKYVGGWRIGGSIGLTVNQTRRPRWLTRVLCRWLLEWEWVEVGRE